MLHVLVMLYVLTSFNSVDCAGQHILADKVGPEIRRLKLLQYVYRSIFFDVAFDVVFDVVSVIHVVYADFLQVLQLCRPPFLSLYDSQYSPNKKTWAEFFSAPTFFLCSRSPPVHTLRDYYRTRAFQYSFESRYEGERSLLSSSQSIRPEYSHDLQTVVMVLSEEALAVKSASEISKFKFRGSVDPVSPPALDEGG